MQYLISLAVFLAAYIFLRSYGGKGLNIKAKLPPVSTPEGKRARIVGFMILALLIGASVYLTIDGGLSKAKILSSTEITLMAAVLVLVPNILRNRKR